MNVCSPFLSNVYVLSPTALNPEGSCKVATTSLLVSEVTEYSILGSLYIFVPTVGALICVI